MLKQGTSVLKVHRKRCIELRERLFVAAFFLISYSYQVSASVIDLDFSNQDNVVSAAQGTDTIWGLGPTYSENVIYFKNVAYHEGVTVDAKVTTSVWGTYTWDTHIPNYKQNTASEPNGDIGFRYWSSSHGTGGLNYLFEFYDGTGANSSTYATPYVLDKFEIIAYDVDGETPQSENLRVKFSDGLVAWQTGTNAASLTAAPSATDVLFSGPRVNQAEDDPTGAVLLHFEDASQFTLYFESETFSGSSVNPIFSAIDGNWDLQGFGQTTSSQLDYGDAPDSYGTTLAASGASHIATSSLYLGSSKPDTDSDGQPSPNSDADDLDDATDDEEGIVTLTSLEAGKVGLIQATVAGDGFLHAWADFNNNLTFDADEAILIDYPVTTGNEVIPVLMSSISHTGGDIQFRFRLSNQTGVAATGPSTEGEVEDHRFTISDPGIGYIYYPGQNEFYTFAAEDTWPDTFDYDVNDVVMMYRNTLVLDSAMTNVCSAGQGPSQQLLGSIYYDTAITAHPWLFASTPISNVIDQDTASSTAWYAGVGQELEPFSVPIDITITNKEPITADGVVIYNDFGVNGDGVKDFTVELFDSTDNSMGVETLVASGNTQTDSIVFSQTYTGVSKFTILVTTSGSPAGTDNELQIREIGLTGNLSECTMQQNVIRLDINGQLTAYGASYHNGFAVHVPGLNKADIDTQRTILTKNSVPQVDSPLESAASEVVVIMSSDLRSESILGECLYHRVDPSCPAETPKFSFHAYLPLLTPSAQASMPTGAFDPFIFAAGQHRGAIIGSSPGRSLEIHTADVAPTSVGDAISSGYYSTADDDSSSTVPTKYYKTLTNMPWAIILPAQWNHPSEYIDISDAYPDFPAWVTSGGTTNEDWYLSENADSTKTWTIAD
jgi:LruC domain-containing protein